MPEGTPGTNLDPGILRLLEHMLQINASDLYLTAGSAPVFRVEGSGHKGKTVLDGEQVARLAEAFMSPGQIEEFRSSSEMNLVVSLGEIGRFRVNVFRQRGETAVVVRHVRAQIRTLDDLRYPDVLKRVALARRGLVLLVGGTGSGKSTTLAALIDHRNSSETGHIITVEDPIEFVHPHKRCVVSQREIGFDTTSYSAALKNALRQAPDLILIGEIRDSETMEAALTFAETGHLCMSTLHANNANQAIERILGFFPSPRHKETLLQLSLNLRAIVSQRLVAATGGGRAAALEILLDTPRIKDLIHRGSIEALKDAMEQSQVEGCQTFDTALASLYAAGRITPDEALRAADSPNNLRLRLERIARRRSVQDYGSQLRLVTDPPRER